MADLPPHEPDNLDCRCGDSIFVDGPMRCAQRADWFEGDDPSATPPPRQGYGYVNQHDAAALAAWARARRRSIFPWRRRRAAHAIRYAILVHERDLGWRETSMVEWVLR